MKKKGAGVFAVAVLLSQNCVSFSETGISIFQRDGSREMSIIPRKRPPSLSCLADVCSFDLRGRTPVHIWPNAQIVGKFLQT